jgi:hypothetical protein
MSTVPTDGDGDAVRSSVLAQDSYAPILARMLRICGVSSDATGEILSAPGKDDSTVGLRLAAL